jgi:flagellar M-ring protein FliF
VSNQKTSLPAPLAAFVGQVQARLGALTRPTRVLLVSTVVTGLLMASYFGYRQANEPYAILFSQLEQDDAAAIVAKLKELKTAYRLEGGGSTIEVPESKAAELRLELASAGMPRGGAVGFESFDKMRLGATEFEQRVLYRRALEGELARTIGTLGSIQTARVHLVLPEKSVFVTRSEPASASIIVRLRQGRSLGPSEVAGIVHLTASSVPGLTPDRIALVTTAGEMLRRPRPAADGRAADDEDEQAAAQRRVETQLEDRARSMLEKVVGPGHVDVRVTAELDPSRFERVEDHYDPARVTLRSEESSLERAGPGVDNSVAGVPGAESNLPGGGSPAAPAASKATAKDGGAQGSAPTVVRAPEQPYRESHTRNYEVDHVSEKRTAGPGALKRIAVAVVLDGIAVGPAGQEKIVARDRAELDRFTALVRSAVGANDNRGDVVTVDSVPFNDARAPSEPVAAAPSPEPPKRWRAYLPAAVAAALLLILALGARVVGRRRAAARTATAAAIVVPTPLPAPPQVEAIRPPVDIRVIAMQRAAADPATAALVLARHDERDRSEGQRPWIERHSSCSRFRRANRRRKSGPLSPVARRGRGGSHRERAHGGGPPQAPRGGVDDARGPLRRD